MTNRIIETNRQGIGENLGDGITTVVFIGTVMNRNGVHQSEINCTLFTPLLCLINEPVCVYIQGRNEFVEASPKFTKFVIRESIKVPQRDLDGFTAWAGVVVSKVFLTDFKISASCGRLKVRVLNIWKHSPGVGFIMNESFDNCGFKGGQHYWVLSVILV